MTGVVERLRDHAPALIAAAALLSLGTVFAMENFWGLAPCPLCISQRWAWGGAGVAALGALVPAVQAEGRRVLLWACALAFVIGTGFAVYHTGVEQHWFELPATCSGVAIRADSVDELRRALLKAPVVRCDEIPWALFGISLAGYNVIASAFMAGFSAWAALAGGRRAP